MALPGNSLLDRIIGRDSAGPLANPEQAFQPTGLLGAFGGGEGLLNFGLSMLANSGPSPQRQSFGQIFGNSYLQAQQLAQQKAAQKLQEDYLKARMEELQRPEVRPPVKLSPGDQLIDPSTGRPIASLPGVAEPPKTRTVTRGDREVTQEWDPEAKAFKDIAEAPRWAPNVDTPTPSFSQVQLDDGSIGAFNMRTGEIMPTGRKGKPTKPPGMDLRKEFENQDAVKNYMTVLPLYERATTAPNTRAGDISVIYALGKMFDPTSVVREGELTLSQNAAPWLAKVVNEAKSQITGQGALSPTTRKQIMDALKGQVDALRSGYERERQRFSDYAPQYGATPDEIVGTDPAAGFGPKSRGKPPARIKSDADYNNLPSGAEFIAPDGTRRRKP